MTIEPGRTRGESSFAAAKRPLVDGALEALLTEELRGLPETIATPIRHAVLAPGKRIRPLLLLAAYRTAGGTHPAASRLACSVELVHAYSLVHDDLPCMDDDVLRRGRPTLHVEFGVAAAILAGAALMPLAVRAIHTAGARMDLSDDRSRRLTATLASASGGGGMVGGQLLDLQAEGREVSQAELRRIHDGKTARLMSAAVVMGGIAAQAPSVLERRFSRFGRTLGLAFQVADDILDMTGTADEMGKRRGRDVELAKATTPSVLGMEEARELGRRLEAQSRAELEGVEGAETLRELARTVVERTR